MLAPSQLCVHLAYTGLGTFCGSTLGLQHAWITPPGNKGMSDIPMAPCIFFCLPKSPVNLPGLEWLQDIVLALNVFLARTQVVRLLNQGPITGNTDGISPLTIQQHAWTGRQTDTEIFSPWHRPHKTKLTDLERNSWNQLNWSAQMTNFF